MRRILTTKANKRKKLIESSIDFSFPCASVVQTPPGMQETQEMQVWSLDPEDSLKEKMATHSSYSYLGSPMDRGAWQARVQRVAESDTIERTHKH